MQISKDIRYVGVNDHAIDLFEGQYEVPNGMAYNSYVILDEKTAVMDSVDARFGEAWLAKLAAEGAFAVFKVVGASKLTNGADALCEAVLTGCVADCADAILEAMGAFVTAG